MKVISLFSGAGGLDLGFEKAGAKIVWANDIDKDHAYTYRMNLKFKEIIVEDIKKILRNKSIVSSIPDGDIIIGGFPCLGFTIAKGKYRRVQDKHNFLYKYFLKMVKIKQPNYFLIENVPGMIKGESFRRFFNNMIKEFEEAGYVVVYTNPPLNAADYGVPQVRKRIIILGSRKDLPQEMWLTTFPPPTHSKTPTSTLKEGRLKKWVTVREAIGDLPLEPSPRVPNHIGTKHKVKINNFLGNRPLSWDKPAPTIMGRGSRTGGPVIHPHPNLHRRLTVRECARLQSFPDDFIFYGSISSQYAQVGDAVPPILAFRLAQHILQVAGFRPKKFDPSEWKLPWVKEWKE